MISAQFEKQLTFTYGQNTTGTNMQTMSSLETENCFTLRQSFYSNPIKRKEGEWTGSDFSRLRSNSERGKEKQQMPNKAGKQFSNVFEVMQKCQLSLCQCDIFTFLKLN